MSDVVTSRSPLVLTVTPNPSLDLLFETDRLSWDDANRMEDPRRRPGGQGVNVARAIRALGHDAAAALLIGGRTGDDIAAALHAEDIAAHVTRARGETRTFVAVRERSTGRSLLLNARGPARDRADAEAFAETVTAAIAALRPRWVACCGSLPRGFPDSFHADVARAAHTMGAKTVIDCDGVPLRAGVDVCDLLVPNEHEASRLSGCDVGDPQSAARAAVTLRAGTSAAHVAITLGDRGAVLAGAQGCWHAQPPAIATGSAVGAGDAFLAGLLIALDSGTSDPDALGEAVAAGTAALMSEGYAMLDAGDSRRLRREVVVQAA